MPFRLHAHALTLYDNMAATVLHTYSVLNVTLECNINTRLTLD